MNEALNFAFEDHLVRVLQIDGEPWFVANDVCASLGLAKADTALARLDEDEKGSHTVGTLGGPQQMTIISEPGVYRLVFSSRKPEAEVFKRWIAHKVLPALRKTGQFRVGDAPPPALPAPLAAQDGALGLLNWRLAAVKEARLLFGPRRAAALWREMGLPEAQPLPGPDLDADGRECLDVLMRSPAFDRDMGQDLRGYLHIVLSLEDEGAAAALASHGIRCVFDGEQGILVANAGETLDRVYAGTRWAVMRWRYGLRAVPGARPHQTAQRFGGATHRSTFIPLTAFAA